MTSVSTGVGDSTPRGALRFEGTAHPGEQNTPLSRISDLDLDRVPDPQGGVRLVVTAEEVAALLDRGYEVRLYRTVLVEPLSAELTRSDEQVTVWLEERVAGIPREEES
jgi:hypothetical protein